MNADTAPQTLNEYLTRAEATLEAIERAVDASGDIGVVCERCSHGLTLELENGATIIISLQIPLQEIWLAAKTGGFHYRYQAGHWHNTRDDSELFAALSTCVSVQLGKTVRLTAD